MTTRLIIGIAAWVCGVACAIYSGFLTRDATEKVNTRLTAEERINPLGWHVDKDWKLRHEYRRLYPEGDLPGDFRKAWETACKAAGVSGCLFHDLRRSAVTAMIQENVPMLVAMQISGHKTTSMFSRYGIRVESEQVNAMAQTEAYHAAQRAKRQAATPVAMQSNG